MADRGGNDPTTFGMLAQHKRKSSLGRFLDDENPQNAVSPPPPSTLHHIHSFKIGGLHCCIFCDHNSNFLLVNSSKLRIYPLQNSYNKRKSKKHSVRY